MLNVLKEIAELDLPEHKKEALFARCQPTINKMRRRMASARNQLEQGISESEVEDGNS